MISIACVDMGDDQRQTVLMDVTGLRLSNPRFTREVFDHLLSLYDQVVEAVYQSRIKDSKKLAEALEDDRWRYQELPETLAEDDTRITKPQLERLVRWKITHGQNRPFLLSQIRKNAASQVTNATFTAFAKLKPLSESSAATQNPSPSTNQAKTSPDKETVHKAIVIFNISLTGVGPATASLLLSIRCPDVVPFFSDELFAWLCRDAVGPQKMAYTVKEYLEVFEEVQKVRKMMDHDRDRDPSGSGTSGRPGVTAVEVEKVAFVRGHLDVLMSGEEGKGVLDGIVRVQNGDEVHASGGSEDGDSGHGPDEDEYEDRNKQQQQKSTRKRSRAASTPKIDDVSVTTRSKSRKK